MPRNKGTSRKGKPKKMERASGMGRALMKAQNARKVPKSGGEGGMQPAHVQQNIGFVEQEHTERKSILEMDDMADFMMQAEMANREFVSTKERFVMVDATGSLLDQGAVEEEGGERKVHFEDEVNAEEKVEIPFTYDELSVPRRPAWTKSTTAAELDEMEKKSFLEWRRNIAILEERAAREQGLHQISQGCVTPFEKNLEVWRQLWRVMESSSCMVLIADARNPLFYISTDLLKYATQELEKPVIVVVNKSDYLSKRQRELWFIELSKNRGLNCVFFSAFLEQQILDEGARTANNGDAETENEKPDSEGFEARYSVENIESFGVNEPLSRQELLSFLGDFAKERNCKPNCRHGTTTPRIQFGMIGFPNVGKSSVINVLMGNSKHTHGQVRVGVASQPGKTKHFQTLLLPDIDDMMLCDCPGLVFPSFVSSKADLIAAGVYPIEQMRDFWPVVNTIVSRIPREVLNIFYGIRLPLPPAWKSHGKIPQPTGEDLLKAYCVSRSLYAAGSGQPHYQQASRTVIRDYVEGKLLFCHPPPHDESLSEFEAQFYEETLSTSLKYTGKLRDNLKVEVDINAEQDSSPPTSNDDLEKNVDNFSELDLLEADGVMDILEAMEGLSSPGKVTDAAGKEGKTKKHRMKKPKKPKKGKREKDPYGCHPDPDYTSSGSKSYVSGGGLAVSAGKYSSTGYTRPNYSGARAAVKHT